MSNFLLKDPKCVFIHIPKTAGTSIRKGVWKSNYEGPVFGYIPKEWEHLYSFAFTRHPLQRLVSAYKMFTIGTEGDPQWKFPKDAKELTISSFMDIVLDETIIYDERRKTFDEKIRHHTIPQTHPFNCLDKAKFIGKQENFDKDFETVCQTLKINKIAPKMHTTNSTHWSDILDKTSIERAVEYYREDFKLLDYKIIT